MGNDVAYKLLHLRRDGTLGPLFIHRRQVIEQYQWLRAEDWPTRGYAHRPGWHCAPRPYAPHLCLRDRVWCRVRIHDYVPLVRPAAQGGTWWLAKLMYVAEILNEQEVNDVLAASS